MTKKKNKNIMLLITFILTLIHIAFIVFIGVAFAFNLFGIVEYLDYLASTYIENGFELSVYMTSYYFELIISAVVNIYSAIFYYKGFKYRINNKQYAKYAIFNGIIQILFSGLVPGIFGIISGTIMLNKKPKMLMEQTSEQSFLSDYKLMAMSEAVERLKELRKNGAISEEEYYANLNKILES